MRPTLQPGDLAEALAAKAEHPEALPIAGGTDLMVDLNFDRRRPDLMMDLNRVGELEGWERVNGTLRIGAGTTFTQVVQELGELAPGLAMASRTVGSPQIRNRGTLGGNLATSSPAGDALPPLVALGAEVELQSTAVVRTLPVGEFLTGPKRNAMAPDELITAVLVPVARGPQQFAKIGTRNAMVIAVCSFALCLDPEAGTVGTAIGSAAPTVVPAVDAERFLCGVLEEGAAVDDAVLARFGELVGAAASPISDVRGSAAYRRHALAVLARRTLAWAWEERCA
jgi:CO/xanthine dehydrogenase FAD-binding subunit